MYKFVALILPFMWSWFKGTNPKTDLSYEEAVDLLFNRAKTIVSSMAMGLIGFLLVTIGLLNTFFYSLAQYDLLGTVLIGATFIGSLALAAVGGGLIYVSARRDAQARVSKSLAKARQEQQQATASHSGSPIQDALSALVMDYIKDREADRAERQSRKIYPEPEPGFDGEGRRASTDDTQNFRH